MAGVAQLLLLWIAVRRAGFKITLRLPRLTPEVRRLAVIAAPAGLGGRGGAGQSAGGTAGRQLF